MVRVVTATYTRAREGGFNATVVGGIGTHAQGETLEEARRNLRAAALDILELAPHQVPTKPRRPRGVHHVVHHVVETLVLRTA